MWNLDFVLKKWNAIAQEDRLKARLWVEKTFESLPIEIQYEHKWDVNKPPRGLYSLLPETEKNAGIINDILIKSWDTQGSYCHEIPHIFHNFTSGTLVADFWREINCWLNYYFKCLNVADNIQRVIGIKEVGPDHLTNFSWLKIGDYVIDNTFLRKDTTLAMLGIDFRNNIGNKYIDEDPGQLESLSWLPTAVYTAVGMKNERLVYGSDEKMEQFIAHGTLCHPCTAYLYDAKMRKFIKEKYGVEIESLPLKWSKLCWNCSAPKENLKRCAVCKITNYCSKDCQVQDWKVHKLLHKAHEDFL